MATGQNKDNQLKDHQDLSHCYTYLYIPPAGYRSIHIQTILVSQEFNFTNVRANIRHIFSTFLSPV